MADPKADTNKQVTGQSRWERLSGIYHAACQQPPEARHAFLDDACSGDPGLRVDVESLLKHDLPSLPAFAVLAAEPTALPGQPVVPGHRIGSYEIATRIGKGGMGEVWRASDSKLGRDVAIKALPGDLAHDAERLARFNREARLLASLNHPNIAAIYGLEEDHGTRYLILELVEGPSLADRLDRGALEIEEALKVAEQIAEALEEAHERGIIHRDLKPSNIKLRSDGTVKVLDFGLAKALEPAGLLSPGASRSPTITTPALTQSGLILGTPAYMAPEQALGKQVDRRADIWAFGCVLYEMLTGQPAFRGDVVSETLAAVIRGEPDWQLLPRGIAPGVARLLRRCLNKDVHQRLQAIGEARILMGEVLSGDAMPEAGPVHVLGRKIWLIAILVGLSMAVAAGLAAWRLKPVQMPPRNVVQDRISLPPGLQLAQMPNDKPVLAMAPDERHLAVVAVKEGQDAGQVYLWSFEEYAWRPVPGSTGADTPFFSADGQWLGFYNGQSKLMKVPVQGGVAEPFLDIVNPFGISESSDQRIAVGALGSVLQTLSEDRRTLQSLTRFDFDTGESLHAWPSWLPGNNSVLFNVVSNRSAIAVQSLGTDTHRTVIEGDKVKPVYSPSGHLLWAQAGNLMAAPFDLEHLQVRPNAVQTQVMPGVLHVGRNAVFSLSASGSLAYVPGEFQAGGYSSNLVRINRDGTVRQVFRGTSQYLYLPRLSPDGLLAAVDVRGEGGQYQVAIYDFERGQLTPFTYPAQDDNRHALWTGSKRIVWQSRREGTRQLFSQAIDGGEPERLTSFSAPSAEVETYTFPSSYCGDGRLLVGRLVPTSEIYVLKGVGAPAQNRTSDRLKLPVGADGGAALSPDCNWIAYVSDESGRREVYVREFPSLRNMHQISTGGGSEPMWNPDRAKHELFYRSGQDMMAADINEQGLPRRMPEILFRGLYNTAQGGYAARNYDVFPDGSFLMLKPQEQKPATQIHVVLGWSEQLKRLVPTEGP